MNYKGGYYLNNQKDNARNETKEKQNPIKLHHCQNYIKNKTNKKDVKPYYSLYSNYKEIPLNIFSAPNEDSL